MEADPATSASMGKQSRALAEACSRTEEYAGAFVDDPLRVFPFMGVRVSFRALPGAAALPGSFRSDWLDSASTDRRRVWSGVS